MRQFITEHLSNFIAPDGGGMLHLNDKAPPLWGCSLERTDNGNAILYLIHPAINFLEKFPEFEPQYKEAFERHMGSTEIIEGLHSRRCGDRFIIGQSHDNILAMLIGGYYLKSEYGKKVFKFLKDHNFNYNVADPDLFDSRCQMQGGDIAVAFFTQKEVPQMWLTIWLALGLAFSKKWNLVDLRITFLKDTIFKSIPKTHSILIAIGIFLHGLRRGLRSSKYRSFDFPPEHPFVRFLEGRE